MTYTAPLFSTTPTLGVDMTTSGYDQPYTLSTSTPEYPGTPLQTGQTVLLAQGGKATYVLNATGNSTSISQGAFCYLQVYSTSGQMVAAGLTSAIAATAGQAAVLGVAMATLTTGQFGWVQTQGNSPAGVIVVSGTTPYTTLHTSATAGVLTGTNVTGTSFPINNITTTVTGTATSNSAQPAVLNNPIINTATTLG